MVTSAIPYKDFLFEFHLGLSFDKPANKLCLISAKKDPMAPKNEFAYAFVLVRPISDRTPITHTLHGRYSYAFLEYYPAPPASLKAAH